jgi:hypothetical protein
MELSKQEVLAILARAGRHDLIDEAERVLPDTVDTDSRTDQEKLAKLGVTRGQLVDRLGGSP